MGKSDGEPACAPRGCSAPLPVPISPEPETVPGRKVFGIDVGLGMTCATPSYPQFPTCAQCAAMGIYIPPVLHRLEARIGHPALVAFLLEKGGQEIGIPVKPLPSDDSDPVSQALEALRQDPGFGRWHVPQGPTSARAELAWGILCRLKAGIPYSRIATDLRCSVRTIGNRKSAFKRRGLLNAPQHLRTPAT